MIPLRRQNKDYEYEASLNCTARPFLKVTSKLFGHPEMLKGEKLKSLLYSMLNSDILRENMTIFMFM